jgi:hypothetical protein
MSKGKSQKTLNENNEKQKKPYSITLKENQI